MAAIDKYTRTTEILWRKRDSTDALSQREGPEPLPGQAFVVFLGTLHQGTFPVPTSRMVLIYYAQVCFGWLSFGDKGEDVG